MSIKRESGGAAQCQEGHLGGEEKENNQSPLQAHAHGTRQAGSKSRKTAPIARQE